MAFLEIRSAKSVFLSVGAIARIESRANDQPGAAVVLLDGTRYEVAEVADVVVKRIGLAGEADADSVLTQIVEDVAKD
jgi:hypothetical protein